jgi:hypothetical protein
MRHIDWHGRHSSTWRTFSPHFFFSFTRDDFFKQAHFEATDWHYYLSDPKVKTNDGKIIIFKAAGMLS